MRGRGVVTGVLLTLVLSVLIAAAPGARAASTKPIRQLLESLPVSTQAPGGYARSAFRHWITIPGTGCRTREVVLIAERVSGTVKGCRVEGGAWVSTYDDVRVTDPRSLDIDHMVPLKEAWISGAWRWSSETRTAYANDVGYDRALIAVTASTNRSKGDRDPGEWLPERHRCAYLAAWVGVKYRWRLSVDPAEKAAIRTGLRGCPRTMTVPPLASRTTEPTTRPSTAPDPAPGLDPRFRTCGEANAAGFGPYTSGRDPEYDWYIDRDRDGVACER